ncbi:thiamine-phosphate kinase [Aeropyrum pernix]|nr:thiamine-monophosphate kinase [Aeropyrum pernix]
MNGFVRWMDKLKVLSSEAGSKACWGYDACPAGDSIIASIDGYSMDSSRLPWMSLGDWGWKSVVAAASDIAASGGAPFHVMYSLGLDSVERAVEVARGVGEAAVWMGATVGKSDFNTSKSPWIDVAVLGKAEKPLGRFGAKPGMTLVQVGASGYGLLSHLTLQGRLSRDDLPGPVVEYTRRPKPPLRIGPELSSCEAAASIDNSDGLGASLHLLGVESGVSVVIDDILVDRHVEKVLDELGLEKWAVLQSWEDYNIVAVGGDGSVECILRWCRRLNIECATVGYTSSAGAGRVLIEGGRREFRVSGWTWL